MQKFQPTSTGINDACAFLFNEDNPDRIFNIVTNSFEEAAPIKLQIIKNLSTYNLELNKGLCLMNRLVAGDFVLIFHNIRDFDYYNKRGKVPPGCEVRIHE